MEKRVTPFSTMLVLSMSLCAVQVVMKPGLPWRIPPPSYTSTSSYKENICELPLGPSAMVHSALETIENVHGSLLYFMRSLAVAPSASQHHSFWFLLSLCSVVLSVLPLFFFTAGSDQSLLLLPVWPIGTPLIAIFPQRGLLSVNLLSSLRLNTIQSS